MIDFLKFIRYNTNENSTKVNGGFMNELDIEMIKEKYIQYKQEHYEDERQMRKLLKMKRMIPNLANDENWKKDYQRLNDNLADGLYYYNELKEMLPEETLKEFVEKVKFKVLKERYLKCKLDKLDDTLLSDFIENEDLCKKATKEGKKVIPKVDEFAKDLLAEKVLAEKELIKKVEIVRKYQHSTIEVFFDTTAVLKAEIARLFIEQMNLDFVDTNQIMTACLVYAFKRTNSPMEKERIKREKEKDKQFLQTLGFDESFCKICGEYNRYHEPEQYQREKEGDILELVDKFVGLIMHREDRLAVPVEDALELLNQKILDKVDNQYKNQFTTFVQKLEKIEVSRDVGIMTYFANTANKNQRQNLTSIIEAIIKIRDLLGGPVNEHKVMRLETMEKVQDKFSIIEFLQKIIIKTKEKIASMSKILRGYKKLSEGSQELDR